MLQVYTGNGKGKTTASLGLIARALGRKHKVCLIQFMKKNYEYGEINFFSELDNMDIFQFGTAQLVDPNNPNEIDFKEAELAFEKCEEVLKSNIYDLVVIDEINVAVSWNLLSFEKQLSLVEIETKSEVVMTGRYAREELLQKADLVTEMCERKHYFSDGVEARKGIEF